MKSDENKKASDVRARFSLGQVVATPGALRFLADREVSVIRLLDRHVSGDWGDLTDDDKAENELSIREGFRIMSSYLIAPDEKIWIITEADRSSTTVLLPEEY